MAATGRKRTSGTIRDRETVGAQISRENYLILLWASIDKDSPDQGRTRSIIIGGLIDEYCAIHKKEFEKSGGAKVYEKIAFDRA